MFASLTSAQAEKENGGSGDDREGWLSRAVNKVSRGVDNISHAASSVSARTASLLDFRSGATDVICLRGAPDKHGGWGFMACTSFNVHVGRDNKSSLSDETVDVLVNGRRTTMRMEIGDAHNCFFPGGGLSTSESQLARLDLNEGYNRLEFMVSSAPNSRFGAGLWVWSTHQQLVVCDIDGTLTRADLFGHSAQKLGFDAAHAGVCECFAAIAAAGYQLLYVSARPITKAARTRELLATLRSADCPAALPPGPLITTAERTLPALVRTLQRQAGTGGADAFKIAALQDVAGVFAARAAEPGCAALRGGVLHAGFGNRPTDAQVPHRTGPPRQSVLSPLLI